MTKTVEAINTLNLAVKNKRLTLALKVNPSIIKVLNILVDSNLIEYRSVTADNIEIRIKYKDSLPVLKSINYMGGSYKNNVTWKALKKELDNKKCNYVILTNVGILTLEGAVKNKKGGLILFKITI